MERSITSPVANFLNFPHLDVETKQDKLDSAIVKIFPYFVVACSILSIIIAFFIGGAGISVILGSICMGFVSGFALLGVFCVLMADKGYYTWKITVPLIVLLPFVVGTAVYYCDYTNETGAFLINFFDLFHGNVSLASTIISAYTITLMVLLCAYSVVSVIVAYFRSYLYRILRVLEKDPNNPNTRKAKKFLMVPDIIDVQSVELEPVEDDDCFNTDLFVSITLSLYVLGMIICSYIFLNPFFVSEVPAQELLFIAILLSLFLSPLVIPWNIVKSIGAKVISQAPRDYYIWKGLKSRLYQGFFTFALVMMLFLMSLYLGMDFQSIAITYVGYIVFMTVISIVTSFVYVNTFYKGFKNGLMKSFIQSKMREKEKNDDN